MENSVDKLESVQVSIYKKRRDSSRLFTSYFIRIYFTIKSLESFLDFIFFKKTITVMIVTTAPAV